MSIAREPASLHALYSVASASYDEDMKLFAIRVYAAALLTLALLFTPSSAMAQYQPKYQPRPLNDPATGEKFHVEAAVGLWFPSADIVVASE